MEHRLQGFPLQNNPNLLFMQEKQSRPWDTDGGKPSSSALVRAVLMWRTSSKVRFSVPPSKLQLLLLPPVSSLFTSVAVATTS